jgi:DNA-binding LacI/PurR family transcriptional regulator
MNDNRKSQRSAPGHQQPLRPTIGLFTNHLVELHQKVWLGAMDAARAQQVNLICFVGKELERPDNFLAQANAIYDLVSPEHIDGLIIWTAALQQFIDQPQLDAFCRRYQPLPIVSLEQVLAGSPSLLVANQQGMYAAVSHLIEVHGHQRIAFIRGPANHSGAQERYQGYLEALALHGLPVDPTLVAPPLSRWQPEEASVMAHQLLEARDPTWRRLWPWPII